MHGRYHESGSIECPSCGALVGAASGFCPECGTRLVRHADAHATHASRGRSTERPAWVIPVLIVAAVGAIGMGAVLAVLLGGGGEASPIGSTTSPTEAAASASVGASPSPDSASPHESPSLSPEPTATPRPAYANRSILEVVTGGLNLRSQAGTGAAVIGVLDEGARLFTIGQPQDAEGERWYRVAVVAGPYSECEPGFCPRHIGYVAEGIQADAPYLRAASPDCPSSPMTAQEPGALHPLVRLSCYGGSSIVVVGRVDHCYCDGPIGVEYEPFWLAAPVSQFLFHGTTNLWLRFEDGEPEPGDLEAGDIVEATVAMEHEDAPGCSAEATLGDDDPPVAEVVLECRTQIVVESLTVTGHDPEVGG